VAKFVIKKENGLFNCSLFSDFRIKKDVKNIWNSAVGEQKRRDS
jgi:hypothetical protein